MRLNWCLKYSPSLDDKDELKPTTLEQYMVQCGAELYLPLLVNQYKDLYKAPNQATVSKLNDIIYTMLKEKTSMYANSVTADRHTIWDGISAESRYSDPNSSVRSYDVQDKLLIITYMRVDRLVRKPERYQICLSQQRYISIAPLQYYYTTQDIDLDN